MKNKGAAKPLLWRQGLFMRPQHLQLNDLKIQSDLAPYRRFSHPHLRGAIKAKLEKEALQAEIILVAAGEFWFKDGTFAVVGENAALSSRSFKEMWSDGGDPLNVYVGLKTIGVKGASVAVIKDDAKTPVNARFVFNENSGEEVPDLYLDGPEAEIERLDYQLQIFFEPEISELSEYDLIRIAELVMVGDEIRLKDSFAPPCLALSVSRALTELVEKTRQRIVAAIAKLDELKRGKGVRATDFGAGDIAWLLALRSLNRTAADLTHLFEADAHPWDFYRVLRRAAAELSTFSDDAAAVEGIGGRPSPPTYDHDRLGDCFLEMSELLSRLLREISSGPDYVVPLSSDEDFARFELKSEHFEERRFYLAVDSALELEDILDSARIDLKLCASSEIEELVRHATAGIKLEHVADPPPALPRREGRVYFRFKQSGERWETAEKDLSLSLEWDLLPDKVKVELIPLKKER